MWYKLRYKQGMGYDTGLIRTHLSGIGHLLVGNFMGTLLGFTAFAMTARALGPLDYGILAMVFAYTRAIGHFVQFQSWQPIVKYATELDARLDAENLKALMKFGFILDLGGAIASFIVAIGLALSLYYLVDWFSIDIRVVVLYSTILLFNWAEGMPTAVLRLAGRFRLLAYSQVVGAAIRVVFCTAAYYMGGGLLFFAVGWAALQIWSSILILILALREMRGQGLLGFLGVSIAGITARFPGIWRFSWFANLAVVIRSSAQELDTLVVGWLADPASAGLYHIAKRVARLSVQVGAQVQAVIFPDLSRLWAEDLHVKFQHVVRYVELILGAFGIGSFLFVLVAAEPLLNFVAGPEFGPAAKLLIVQMLAAITALSGISLRLGLLAMGRSQQVLVIVTLSTIVFHITALSLIPQIGAMGASIAHITMGLVWISGLTWSYKRALNGSRTPALRPSRTERAGGFPTTHRNPPREAP